jgi:hypothetical protein
LGWAEEVAVMIGTEQFSASEVFPSKAKQTSKTCRVDKSHAISIGLTGVGINLNAGKAWQKTARPSTIAWDRCKGIRDTLSDEHRYSLLIYDTNQQIGWLLPRLSVILYMAHKIFTSREQTGHRLLSGGKETYFRHAKPNADGASAAFSALDELMSFEVRKSRVSDTREGFSVMLEEIIFVMDKVRNALESANTEPGRIRSDLYGVELNDLLELESPVDIKSVPVQQPWTEMVRSRICGLVLFCRGFGQPIVPTSPLMMCSSYQTVPPVRDLLATTGKVLHTFIKKYSVPEGAKLGHTIEWNCKEGRLVQSHTDQQKSPIYHEQDLHHIEKSSPNLELLDSVDRFILSGFIFTDKPQRPCSEVIPPMQSGFLDAVQHPFGEGIKPLPQMPEDDSSSENSNESETRFDIGNLPTSSISSDESPPIEEQDQSIIGRLSRGTAARTGDIVESRQDPAYVIDSVPSKQLAIASYSLSSTPRGLKKKDGCVNLGDFRDKGKGQASVKKTCDERGRERPPASDVARTVTTAPNRQAQRSGKGRERSQHSVRE